MRARDLLLASAIWALALPASAEAPWGGEVEVMSDAEMGELRGGIAIAPNLEIQFGAVVTTYVNGAPALTTNLTWTDAGQLAQETIAAAGQQLSELTQDQRAAMGLSGLGDANGVVIADEAGVTALVHNVTNGAMQNIILNTASGRDLHQDIDVTLTLPGFEMVQAGLLLERIGIRLNEDMRGM